MGLKGGVVWDEGAHVRGVVLAVALLGCSGFGQRGELPVGSGVRPWRAPVAAAAPELLRVEPGRVVVRLGERPRLRVRGRLADAARCSWAGGEGRGSEPALPAASAPGRLDVTCRSGGLVAEAQITYTDATRLPLDDPYAGGVALFKLRRSPELDGPHGSQRTGLPRLDGLLAAFGAHALPALPFDTTGTRDRVGLRRWVAIDIPEGVNFYQAVSLLRACPDIYTESYRPEDAATLRVRATPTWPTPLTPPRPREPGRDDELERVGGSPPPGPPWELQAIRAPAAWERATGVGVGIAVVGTGVDVNHVAVSESLRSTWIDAWILPVDVEENLRRALPQRTHDDLRVRLAGGRLRSSAWARAAGVVYAVVEGAGVVTCAWSDLEPDWIVHDALLYAEDNCVLPVCLAGPGYPAGWAPVRRAARRSGGGDVRDAWTGALHRDYTLRPLRGAVLARVASAVERADVWVPQGRSRVAPAPPSAVAVGLAAGAAAVVRELRSDLEPRTLRRLIAGEGRLDLAGALDRAVEMPPGGCTSIERRLEQRAERSRPIWKRVKVKVSYERADPADPIELDASD